MYHPDKGKNLNSEVKKAIYMLTVVASSGERVNIFLEKDNIQATDCQEITKIIMRTGFELVMPKIKKFTPDLYLCYRSFSEYYPEQETKMKQALQLYLNPSQNVSFVKGFVENFGNWMIEEVSSQFS